MPFLNDLVTILEAASLGQYGTDIFVSANASIPSSGLSIHLIDTGGTAPDNTHNNTTTPAYVQPGAQVTIRGNDYETTMARAIAARNALYAIRNQFINSGWYMWVKIQQEPIDLTMDDRTQCRFAFNVLARKRP